MLESHGYRLGSIDVILSDGKIYNMKGIVSEFTIYESIDSPSVRAEFLVADATDFITSLYGNETVQLELSTDSAPGVGYKMVHKIYKIGSNIKSERMQMYVLHTVSDEAVKNETNRVFKTFKGKASETVKSVLKDNLQTNKNVIIEETQSSFPFISPSWRPFDVISYLTDKCARVGKDKIQSSFMFFENRDGIHFETIDHLIEKSKNMTPQGNVVKGLLTGDQQKAQMKKFTYAQKNVGSPGNNYYNIQRITYPDKYDVINNLRTGVLGNSIIGIDLHSFNESAIPATSSTSKTADGKPTGPGGGNYFIASKSADSYWKEFEHVDKNNPFAVTAKTLNPGKGHRKRLKFIAGAGFAESSQSSSATVTPNLQTANAASKDPKTNTSSLTQGTTNKGGAAEQPKQILESALYSLMRYQAINLIKLNIVVPGNVGVTVGDVIEVLLPAANESGKSLPAESTYSGYYLVLGVVHIWRPEGVTTSLDIGRDSVKDY